MTLEEIRSKALEMAEPEFKKFEPIALANTKKVLEAFKECQVSDYHFTGTTGYGYNDVGREKLDEVFAYVFKGEKAIVRPHFVSGTHALATTLISLMGNGSKGTEFIYAVGAPYDTMQSVIGAAREVRGSLVEKGFTYTEVPLKDNTYDVEAIANAVNDNTRVVVIQRSRGYSTREPLSIADIKIIVDAVKAKNSKTICFVDNCYGEFTELQEPLEAGADICAQSTHKIIGALTQGSLLHVKSNLVNPKRVQQVLNLMQTTSPSYILMASLDCARRQIALEGKELLAKTIDLCNYTRSEINKIPGFHCFGSEVLGVPGSFAFDPTKLTISCRGLGITGYELDTILADKYHIQMELSDFYNVLAVGSFGDTKDGMDKLLSALKEISDEYYGKRPATKDFLDIPQIPKRILNPREAFNSKKEDILLEKSEGKISAEFLLAYPPGIPILCPGEVITKEIIEYVHDLKRANLYVQGTEDSEVKYIKIVKE